MVDKRSSSTGLYYFSLLLDATNNKVAHRSAFKLGKVCCAGSVVGKSESDERTRTKYIRLCKPYAPKYTASARQGHGHDTASSCRITTFAQHATLFETAYCLLPRRFKAGPARWVAIPGTSFPLGKNVQGGLLGTCHTRLVRCSNSNPEDLEDTRY